MNSKDIEKLINTKIEDRVERGLYVDWEKTHFQGLIESLRNNLENGSLSSIRPGDEVIRVIANTSNMRYKGEDFIEIPGKVVTVGEEGIRVQFTYDHQSRMERYNRFDGLSAVDFEDWITLPRD